MRKHIPLAIFIGWALLLGAVCYAWTAFNGKAATMCFVACMLLLPRKRFNGEAILQQGSPYTLALVAVTLALIIAGILTLDDAAIQAVLRPVVSTFTWVIAVVSGYRVFLLRKAP